MDLSGHRRRQSIRNWCMVRIPLKRRAFLVLLAIGLATILLSGHSVQESVSLALSLPTLKRENPHIRHPNGLLEANKTYSHPIYYLIREAEIKWKTKSLKSSTTLREAVTEYQRRYGRMPPRNFDKWLVQSPCLPNIR